MIFQPYGKDDFCINLIMSNKVLAFGVSDPEDLDEVTKISQINSYIQLSGKNPKYYKVVESKFKLKNDSNAVFESRTLKKAKTLYVLLLYNKTDEFIYMRYVESEEEYAIVKEKFNVLACMIIIGGKLKIVDEDIVSGIGYSKKRIAGLVKSLRSMP